MAKFFNILLIAFAVFFLSFVWLYFYVKVAWISALCSGGIALASCLLLYKILPVKTKKYRSRQRKKQLEKFEMYMASRDAAEVIEKVFEKKGYAVFNVKNGFVAKKQNVMLAVPWFGFEPFTKQRLIEAVKTMRKVGAGCIVFFGAIGFDTKPICAYTETKLIVFSAEDTHSLLEKNSLLPEMPDFAAKKDKQFFVYAFSAKRFPYYIVSSVALVAVSFVSFFPIYSLVAATALLAAAVYSKFNKRYNNKAQFEF